jgi:hypothetical protein
MSRRSAFGPGRQLFRPLVTANYSRPLDRSPPDSRRTDSFTKVPGLRTILMAGTGMYFDRFVRDVGARDPGIARLRQRLRAAPPSPGACPSATAVDRRRHLNTRAENSHQPTRQRERAMKPFKSPRHAQRFLSAFSGISAHFRPRRHRLSATGWRTEMADRFAVCNEVTELDAAA